MDDALDCLIDLNSPVSNCLVPSNGSLVPSNGSLVPPIRTSQKAFPACTDLVTPALDDNNPFDLVVRLTQMNEADKNDPFEIAFEQACGYQMSSDCTLDGPKDSAKPIEMSSEECAKDPPKSQPSNECIDKELCPSEDFNLDDIQPPDFLANSSFELSDNDSININDTLHLSSMSDLKLTPGETVCSPLTAKYGRTDNGLSGECVSPISSRVKSFINNETLQKADFFHDCSTSSDKSSFEESPSKVLSQLKSEESVKTLIEGRIQKCIAKALNNSNLQFRNSILLEPGENSFVVNQANPLGRTLRTSLSVPQNLHLLVDDEIGKKPEQASAAPILSPMKPNIFEDLTIPVLDDKTEALRNSDIITDINPEDRSTKMTGIQEEKISQYRLIIDAELLKIEHNPAPALEVKTDSKPRGRRRSLSCDVVLPPALPLKGSSPPKLPPLPLSSDTIRDLNLCSKYSPPKPTIKSPRNTSAKVTKRTVPFPACPQPKLVLRKKITASVTATGPLTATGPFNGATNGPMKAVIPVRNMTRFAGGSPRPSAQSQNRRGSIAISRQNSLESPNYQKPKLCPLAASTPSNPTIQENTGTVLAQPVITAPTPRRVISRAIPSPSRRMSVSSHNPKPDTPTRRTSFSSFGRNANPRVLVDKNGLASPSLTPVRKTYGHTEAHSQAPGSNNLDKENMTCL